MLTKYPSLGCEVVRRADDLIVRGSEAARHPGVRRPVERGGLSPHQSSARLILTRAPRTNIHMPEGGETSLHIENRVFITLSNFGKPQ